MEIKTNATDRKALVRAIADITGAEAKYAGPPTFNYTVDYFTIDRNSIVSFDDRADSEEIERLLEGLSERGFIDAEPEMPENLEITVPIDGMDGCGLRNLVFTLHSKQYLLNRITRHDSFKVSDTLVATLENEMATEVEAFFTAVNADTGETRGLCFDNDKVTFTFPLSENPAKNRAYAELSAFMVAHAKEASRVSPNEQRPENEKYYLRSWLLRIGLTGMGGKESRKALLEGLNGHTAFRTPADAEKHKARLAARKEALAQASEDTDEE